ncbi:N-acetylmuramoyl-L-alanine amidase-like domain-containing protein [Parabacteroides sp. PF5-9]|uniref:N-acetylmuramoyl-L-alanine amidase-like domain-containing protein n=1 Tax=Parabacteroides sp. PF5-9 TaxID=1742404 RepID=UPI002475B993|nr:N-acetylmuramoyl-L-alanine amidase-like domain-containing protein [Parabacteroides sp. PF5-9]MDH6358046.1 hypothetical protein [Parabacteroides sp. PF5-9]
MKKKVYLLLAFYSFLCALQTINAQTINAEPFCYIYEDRLIFERFAKQMLPKRSLPMDQLLIETGKYFLNTPYVASTLEKEPESLVINLREMDCTTFVENVIALSQTIKSPTPSFEHFCRNLQRLRYRNGKITDYSSRLHYTSDWIYTNERKGFVKDITRQIGGVILPLNLSFMSTHPDSYIQLKNHPDLIPKIEKIERDINTRMYYYLPKELIKYKKAKMQNGDMVCFVTSIKGLDISHIGFIYHEGDKLTFIHASSKEKKVIINSEPLSTYTENMKSNTGIIVVRPLQTN